MTKTALQLHYETQRLSQRLIYAKASGRNAMGLQAKLDVVISELDKLLAEQRKENDEIQSIVEELERESIFED